MNFRILKTRRIRRPRHTLRGPGGRYRKMTEGEKWLRDRLSKIDLRTFFERAFMDNMEMDSGIPVTTQ